MAKKAGTRLLAAGAVLMGSALLLFLSNYHTDQNAGREARRLTGELHRAIAQAQLPLEDPEPGETEPTEGETAPDPQLPTAWIDGYEYVGILSVPALELELPVMDQWDYARLRIAPCRQLGSSRTDDLVIAAHNYRSHFGGLSALALGARVCFTDMEGLENQYIVAEVKTLAPEAVDAVLNSGHDLVLYTCTPGGATRVVAFCDRVAQGVPAETE